MSQKAAKLAKGGETRALVAGGAGFVGAELVRGLVRRGVATHVLVRPGSSVWRLVDLGDSVILHRGDVRSRDAVRQLLNELQPNFVLNAVRRREDAANGREAMVDTLVHGTKNLLDAAAASGCERFIQLGSSSEYGPRSGPMEETSAPAPTTAFGAAKAAASSLCVAAGRSGAVATVVLRPFMVYGPRDISTRFVPTALRAAVSGAELLLTPPGQRRDWVFVSDVAEACLRALEHQAENEIINVGTGEDHANEELVAIIERVTGRPISARVGGMLRRPWDTSRWVASTVKAQRLLGWTATTSLEEGLRRTAAAFCASGRGATP